LHSSTTNGIPLKILRPSRNVLKAICNDLLLF
jgi:hypothetical protein